jgi:hypothetical protein
VVVGVELIIAESARKQAPEVMNMPRTVQDILDHADELAKRFDDYTPNEQDERDAESFNALRDAVLSRSAAERSIKNAVDNARTHGYSWALIGSLLGTSGEAARQRYASKQRV